MESISPDEMETFQRLSDHYQPDVQVRTVVFGRYLQPLRIIRDLWWEKDCQ